MSERLQERAKALSRLWQARIVPVENADSIAARREQVTTALASKIGQVAARRSLEQRRRRVAMFMAAAAVLAVLGGTLRAYQIERSRAPTVVAHEVAPVGHVHAIGGTAEILRASGPTKVATVAALQLGDTIRTSAAGEAQLAVGDKVQARLRAGGSIAVLAPTIGEQRFALSRGRLELHVDDRPSVRPKLSVETPDAEVVVTGTVFDVEVTDPSGQGATSTRVFVTKGHVIIRQNGQVVAAVDAGQSWHSGAFGAPSPTPETVAKPASAPALNRNHASPLPPAANGTLAAENELFQSALEAKKQGDDASAVEQLGVILSKYPTSPLSHEARLERMRAYHRMGLAREAAREAGRYLADFPDGAAKDEARRLVMDEIPAQ